MEPGEAPVRGQKLDTGLLVSGSISSGLVPGVEASGRPSQHMLVRLWQSWGWGWGRCRAGEDPRHPEPHLPITGLVPRLPARLPRAPCPDPPHHKHSLPGGGAWQTHSLGGRELLDPPLSLDPTQEAEPRLPSILGLGFLRSPPPPQQLTRPAQAPLSSCLPCLALGDIEGLCPTHLPARPSVLGLALMST